MPPSIGAITGWTDLRTIRINTVERNYVEIYYQGSDNGTPQPAA